MKRIAVILAVLACGLVVAVLGTAAKSSESSSGYKVRAIFDSAFSVIPGEDVKVAGVKVGKIESLSVTDDKKAAVVLNIDKPGFGNFRKDAFCMIRPQSLIGEKFVECEPTSPRADGAPLPPTIPEIKHGDGKGQHLLPVTNTGRTVDLDLLNNILRLPFRQRLSIIVNEFGTGLAGRGKDLNQVIRRADPALMQTDKVLKILATQNQVLANLARDSDINLIPLARRRAQLADFIVKANDTAQATADRRGALEANFRKLPRFLRELRPTLKTLGDLSDQASPVLEDLGAQGPNISRFITQLGPFSEAARASLPSLGAAADVGRRSVVKIRPLTRDTRTLAQNALPVADDLEAILTSFKDTGGIERLMDYLFFQVTAINGFDSAGHYLRAALLVNLCSSYQIAPQEGCQATFRKPVSASAASARSAARAGADDKSRSLYLRREQAVLAGENVKDVVKRLPDAGDKTVAKTTARTVSPLRLPAAIAPSAPKPSQAAKAKGATAPRGMQGTTPTGASDATKPQTQLLDYLLGGGA